MIWTSIFGILTLVMLARALGFAKAPVLDEAGARQAADHALPGFRAADVGLAHDARAALVAAADGRVALVRPHGDRWVVRIVERATRDGARLTLRPDRFTATTLDLGSAAQAWAERLA